MGRVKKHSRRIKGEGSYIQRPNGTWEYRIMLGFDANGKMLRKSFYGKRQSDAKAKYDEYMDSKRNGEEICKKMPLASWCDEWLETYKKDTVSATTYSNYEYMMRHIKEADIGKIPLDEVKPIHVRKFLSSRKDTSHSQITKLKALLYGMFETAIENDLCLKNPARNVEPPKIKEEEKEAFSDLEISTIREYASTKQGKNFELEINTLIYTGLRRSELLALMWNDIDFKNSILKLRRAISINEDGDIEFIGSNEKKNHNRDIPIPSHLLELFKEAKTNLEVLRNDKNPNKQAVGNSLYIFCTKFGTVMVPNSFRKPYATFFKNLNKWCKDNDREKVRKLTTHECRHTYASLLLRHGVDSKIIQTLVGHADIEMTHHYEHTDIEALKKAVKFFE